MNVRSSTTAQAIMDTVTTASIATIIWKNRQVMQKSSKWAIAGAVLSAIGEGLFLTKGFTRSRMRELQAIRADYKDSHTSLMVKKVVQAALGTGITGLLARYSSSIPRLSAFLFGASSASIAFTPLNELVGLCQEPLTQL